MDEIVHPRIATALRKAKLSDQRLILSMSSTDLLRITHLSAADISTLQKAIAQSLPQAVYATGLTLNNHEQCPPDLLVKKLTVGCPILDSFLRGGIISKGITEFAGESASGKTQLCLQLCLTVQLPEDKGGLDAGVLYICTENVFPNRRLMQLIQQDRRCKNISYADNIFIEHAAEIEDLSFCLHNKAPLLLRSSRIRLIIVDSIAALFRCNFTLRQSAKRAKLLCSLGYQLHNLSHKFNVPVICVNQVSDVFKRKSDYQSASSHSADRMVPALGLAWSNMVTTRLMLTRTMHQLCDTSSSESVPRTMDVIFAPHLPKSFCYYCITQEGVKGIN